MKEVTQVTDEWTDRQGDGQAGDVQRVARYQGSLITVFYDSPEGSFSVPLSCRQTRIILNISSKFSGGTQKRKLGCHAARQTQPPAAAQENCGVAG